MNTLGKLMVLLIFIMSIFFMTFSFMVFMTQTAWKAKADAANQSLQTQRSANTQLENQNKQLQLQRAAESAARTTAISALEASLSTSQGELSRAVKELNDLKAAQQLQEKQVTGSLTTLQQERSKVDSLRTTINATQAERDNMFAELIDLKNRVLELEANLQRAKLSEAQLLDQVAKQSAVLRAYDLSENENISGVAPKRDGRIREVGPNNKMVVVSLGEDDGIDRGHTLYVHRRDKYLARVRVTKTYPDRSVGRVMEGYQLGAIRSGDSVRTK